MYQHNLLLPVLIICATIWSQFIWRLSKLHSLYSALFESFWKHNFWLGGLIKSPDPKSGGPYPAPWNYAYACWQWNTEITHGLTATTDSWERPQWSPVTQQSIEPHRHRTNCPNPSKASTISIAYTVVTCKIHLHFSHIILTCILPSKDVHGNGNTDMPKNGNGNGKSTHDSGNGNGYFFMYAKNSHRSTRCEC